MAHSDTRLAILLDIDETLVHFIPNERRATTWDALTEEERAKYDTWENQEIIPGIFLIRPHLEKFLGNLFSTYHVGIWTRASASYAQIVLTHVIWPAIRAILDYGVPVSYKCILSADHADKAQGRAGFGKDLVWFWNSPYRPSMYCPINTILIDDNPLNVYMPQYVVGEEALIDVPHPNMGNAMIIHPFCPFGYGQNDEYIDQSTDRELLGVIEALAAIQGAAFLFCEAEAEA
jgi:hypothetical protein